MAKTAKPKKGAKPASVRSRAARRETSPSIDVDKSLKSLPLPEGERAFLAVHNEAGVKKSKSKGKAISRNKRIRQVKGMERAEAVLDQLEKKVETSTKRERTAKERSHTWDEINEKVGQKKKGKVVLPSAQDEPQEDGAGMEGVEDDIVPSSKDTDQEQVSTDTLPAAVEEDLDVVL